MSRGGMMQSQGRRNGRGGGTAGEEERQGRRNGRGGGTAGEEERQGRRNGRGGGMAGEEERQGRRNGRGGGTAGEEKRQGRRNGRGGGMAGEEERQGRGTAGEEERLREDNQTIDCINAPSKDHAPTLLTLHIPCTSTREAKAAQDTFAMSTFCKRYHTCIMSCELYMALCKAEAHACRQFLKNVCETPRNHTQVYAKCK